MQESVKRSSQEMQESVKRSTQIEKNINKTIAVEANNSKAQSDLSNEKLSRLVDILKSLAVEQTKIDQGLQMLLDSQNKVEQVLQGQEVGAIAKQETILTTQKKITDALKDLRRKANVSISRTEDVLKKLKKQK